MKPRPPRARNMGDRRTQTQRTRQNHAARSSTPFQHPHPSKEQEPHAFSYLGNKRSRNLFPCLSFQVELLSVLARRKRFWDREGGEKETQKRSNSGVNSFSVRYLFFVCSDVCFLFLGCVLHVLLFSLFPAVKSDFKRT